MAEHFLSKIRVAAEDFVEIDGAPVLERHQDLRALLAARVGPEVAALFAEPLISRGNDTAPPTVSWYGDATGEARALNSLPPGEQAQAEAYLADHLRPLQALVDDPASAGLALGALSVYGRDDVLVQNGVPVIVNWGLVPGGMGANAATRPAHYAATLGKYLPLPQNQSKSAAPAMAAVAPTFTPPQLDQNAPDTPAGAGRTLPVARAPARISAIAWVPLLILLVIAGLVLAWLLSPGTRLFHAANPLPMVTESDTLKAARALNQSLRDRKDVLGAALDGAVCRADGILLLPDGRTPEGLLPPALGVEPAQTAQAVADALLQTGPNRVLVPDPENTGPQQDQITLLDLIEARTVLILATTPNGVTTGSGLVVGPGLIVTNFHVIAASAAQQGQILVTGAALKQPQLARVLKTQGPLAKAGGDFALLQIEDTSMPAFTVFQSSQSLKLTNVIAAGYPGDVLELDADFAALKSGDLAAVPDLTVTDGTINTEQQLGPDTQVLMHSAPLSGGNSGGPLVDMCGRLVGVNTFTRQGVMQNRGFALSAGGLLGFLKGTPAAPKITTEPCAPVVVRPQVGVKPAQPAKD